MISVHQHSIFNLHCLLSNTATCKRSQSPFSPLTCLFSSSINTLPPLSSILNMGACSWQIAGSAEEKKVFKVSCTSFALMNRLSPFRDGKSWVILNTDRSRSFLASLYLKNITHLHIHIHYPMGETPTDYQTMYATTVISIDCGVRKVSGKIKSSNESFNQNFMSPSELSDLEISWSRLSCSKKMNNLSYLTKM